MESEDMMTLTETDIAGIGMTSQRTRNRMVDRLRHAGIANEAVLDTMTSVPRHLFVDEAMATRAYEDVALPIGEGQTISQPYVVARMTEMVLETEGVKKVLEVGTGSGYQAAILSRLVDTVFSVERLQTVLQRARKRFRALQYYNIHTLHTDGSWGWASNGPYDCIVVTAAPVSVPDTLLMQLAVGGRMIVPVGKQTGRQVLTVIERTEQGFEESGHHDVKFVPMLSGKG